MSILKNFRNAGHSLPALSLATASAVTAANGMAQAVMMSPEVSASVDGVTGGSIPTWLALTLALLPLSVWLQSIGMNAWRHTFRRGIVRGFGHAVFGLTISALSAALSAASVIAVVNSNELAMHAKSASVAPISTQLNALSGDLAQLADQFARLSSTATNLEAQESKEGGTCANEPTDPVPGPRSRLRARHATAFSDMSSNAGSVSDAMVDLAVRMKTGTIEDARIAIPDALKLLRGDGLKKLRRDSMQALSELADGFVDPQKGGNYVCRSPELEAQLLAIIDVIARVNATELSMPTQIYEQKNMAYGVQVLIEGLMSWWQDGASLELLGLNSLAAASGVEILQVWLLWLGMSEVRRLGLVPSFEEEFWAAQARRRTPQEIAEDEVLIQTFSGHMLRVKKTIYFVASTNPSRDERRIIAYFRKLPATGVLHDVPLADLDPEWVHQRSHLWPELPVTFDLYEIPAKQMASFWMRKANAPT